MLLGTYEHALDDKNRLTLPARFREAFSEGVVVTRGMDGCLTAYPRAGFDAFVERRLEGLDPFSKEGRQMARFVYSGASEQELDRQGRISMPQPLLDHAGLTKDCVVTGIRDHVEIWDRAAWRAQLEEVERNAELVAERLAAHE